MPSALRVGLLGCGRLGSEVMLPLLCARTDVQVTVLADPDETARARAAARRPTARAAADWRAALERPDLDAVVVTLPTALHAEVALAAIARGLALYLEKPLASTVEQADAIRDACRGRALTVALGFNARFHPLLMQMRQHVRDGHIGEPRLLRATFSVAARYEGSWRHHAVQAGGVLHDLASHHVDLAHYLLDRALVRVRATRATPDDGGETVAATGEINGGIVFSGTRASGTIDEDAVEVVGTRGSVRLSRYEDLTLDTRGCATPGAGARVARVVPSAQAIRFSLARRAAPWNDPSFGAALDNFITAARRGATVIPGVDEGWYAARAVAAIDQAARTGRTVDL